MPTGEPGMIVTTASLGLWADAWRRLRRNKLAVVGLGIIIVFLVVGLTEIVANFAGILSRPTTPNGVDYALRPRASAQRRPGSPVRHRLPGQRHPLAHPRGHADLAHGGRHRRGHRADRSAWLWARSPATTAAGSTASSCVLPTSSSPSPTSCSCCCCSSVLGPGFVNVFIAIGLLSWAGYARLNRGSVLSVKTHGVHRGGAGAGRQRPAHHLPPRAAQHHGARVRGHRHGRRRRHRHRGRPELPRHRHPAARRQLGQHDRRLPDATCRPAAGGCSLFPAWRWSSPCSGSSRSATACAMPPTPSSRSRRGGAAPRGQRPLDALLHLRGRRQGRQRRQLHARPRRDARHRRRVRVGQDGHGHVDHAPGARPAGQDRRRQHRRSRAATCWR